MGRILVAEDDKTILDLITEVLTFEGHDVLPATNGEDAVAIAKREQPDLVLMDLMMPKLNGIEAIRCLRADPDTVHLRIVAMSAAALLLRHAEQVEADSTLAKPFDIAELLADVEVHLGRVEGDE